MLNFYHLINFLMLLSLVIDTTLFFSYLLFAILLLSDLMILLLSCQFLGLISLWSFIIRLHALPSYLSSLNAVTSSILLFDLISPVTPQFEDHLLYCFLCFSSEEFFCELVFAILRVWKLIRLEFLAYIPVYLLKEVVEVVEVCY